MVDHMTPEEFRDYGYKTVDWLADYLSDIESFPVMADVEPGETKAKLPDSAPETGEAFGSLLQDLDDVVLPGITQWQSPNWFAYFPANSSPPSVLAELVAAGLGAQGMMWSTSPAATEIEERVLDWMVDLLGLPQSWKMDGPGGGVIQMSASDSTHLALVVARHRRRADAQPADMAVYASSQAHSSIEKGCTVAGIGHFRTIGVDSTFALDPAALRSQIIADVDSGLLPIAVVSVIGTTATTAVDPVDAVADIAEQFSLWHHVDAAYAGTAMLADELRHYQHGVERVDSYTVNPHKWMMVNFDCNILWVADREPLIDTMSILPPYLRNEASDSGSVVDYRDWHVPLGRRFRALKLWWVIRTYGAEGLRSFVRGHIELANELATRVETDDRVAVFAPHPFGLVCFTHVEGNDRTRQLAADLNATGKVAVTPSEVDGTAFIRVAIGQTRTEQRHVDALWALIDDLA